jgi:hypothetical protein
MAIFFVIYIIIWIAKAKFISEITTFYFLFKWNIVKGEFEYWALFDNLIYDMVNVKVIDILYNIQHSYSSKLSLA